MVQRAGALMGGQVLQCLPVLPPTKMNKSAFQEASLSIPLSSYLIDSALDSQVCTSEEISVVVRQSAVDDAAETCWGDSSR